MIEAAMTPYRTTLERSRAERWNLVLGSLRPRLMRVLEMRGVDREQAEDHVQEALAQIWRQLASLREPPRLASWATTIVLNQLRSHRVRDRLFERIPDAVVGPWPEPPEILIRAEGVGLSLADHPEVTLRGIAPELLAALPTREDDAQVAFGVTAEIPAHLVGAGLGLTSHGGSLHLQSTDRALLAELGLDRLRLGDVVALQDTDSRYNHGYLRGARAIGVVASTDGPRAGYGPGIAILMTAPAGQLGSFDAPEANLVTLLELEP